MSHTVNLILFFKAPLLELYTNLMNRSLGNFKFSNDNGLSIILNKKDIHTTRVLFVTLCVLILNTQQFFRAFKYIYIYTHI